MISQDHVGSLSQSQSQSQELRFITWPLYHADSHKGWRQTAGIQKEKTQRLWAGKTKLQNEIKKKENNSGVGTGLP